MPTRVSTAQTFDRGQHTVSTARERELRSADVASSGKKITKPSDDPGGYGIAAGVREDLANKETMEKNANLVTGVLNVAENMFGQVQDLVQRCHELAVGCAGDDPSSKAARKFVKAEVENLYGSALQLLNTRYSDRALLAGFKSGSVAFDEQGQFVGDNGTIEVDVRPGLRVPISFSAERLVMGQGLKSGVNILGSIQGLRDGLSSDNLEAIRNSLDTLQRANDQISLARGEIGARRASIDKALAGIAVERIEGKNAIANIEEADAIQAFSDLQRDETVLKAAVSTTDKIIHNNPGEILYK